MAATTKQATPHMWTREEVQFMVDTVQDHIAKECFFGSYRNDDRTAIVCHVGGEYYRLAPYPFDESGRRDMTQNWGLAKTDKDGRPVGFHKYGNIRFLLCELDDKEIG